MQSAAASVSDRTRTPLARIMGKLRRCEAVRSKPSTGVQFRSGRRSFTSISVLKYITTIYVAILHCKMRYCLQSTENGTYRPKAKAFLTPTMGTSSSRSQTHRWDFVRVNSMPNRQSSAAVAFIHHHVSWSVQETLGYFACRPMKLMSLSKVCKLYLRLVVIIL